MSSQQPHSQQPHSQQPHSQQHNYQQFTPGITSALYRCDFKDPAAQEDFTRKLAQALGTKVFVEKAVLVKGATSSNKTSTTQTFPTASALYLLNSFYTPSFNEFVYRVGAFSARAGLLTSFCGVSFLFDDEHVLKQVTISCWEDKQDSASAALFTLLPDFIAQPLLKDTETPSVQTPSTHPPTTQSPSVGTTSSAQFLVIEVQARAGATCNSLIHLFPTAKIYNWLDKTVVPGFADLHIHAPQWPQAGIALSDPLNVWLDQHTFPLEARYQDIDFAEHVYASLVRETLSQGTTTAMYFGTVHVEPTLKLVEQCLQQGQRGFVGKVVMDSADSPDFYRDQNTQSALADTKAFFAATGKLNQQYQNADYFVPVHPVVIPRFVPSCTPAILQALGDFARLEQDYVTTHISECDWEQDFVIQEYGKTDSEVLEGFGLLTTKTVLAHGNRFDDLSEVERVIKHGSSVCSCPLSNSYFANAVLPVKRLHQHGLKITLGSDISGGYSPSVWDNVRHAVTASRMLQDGVTPLVRPEVRQQSPGQAINMINAFYLATAAAEKALSLPLGQLEVGYPADFQVLKHDLEIFTQAYQQPAFTLAQLNLDLARLVFEKVCYLTTARQIDQVYCQGRLVFSQN